MKFTELSLSNFGPIRSGKIHNRKVIVFFGPNNSGKSMVSRMIHSISSLDYISSASLDRYFSRRYLMNAENSLKGYTVLQHAGISAYNVVTHGKTRCQIELKAKKGTQSFSYNNKPDRTFLREAFTFRRRIEHLRRGGREGKTSVYVPAARTGTIQFFSIITQMRSRLLSDILESFGDRRAVTDENVSASELKYFVRSLNRLPPYLEEFYDLILDAQTEGINPEIQNLFRQIFGGTLNVRKEEGILPSILFTDSEGFSIEIENAGSGIIASLPIMLGLYYVVRGGDLIIEEPEAHIEPSRQIAMIEDLCKMGQSKGINLIITTHSEYVIKTLLSLVHEKKLKPKDLGLFYFERAKKGFTTIREIPVNKQGEAEQPTFQNALDILIKKFSI